MLGWRRFLGFVALDAAFFFVSGWTVRSPEHSGTVSDVLWMDFLLGVLLLIALAAIAGARVLFGLWR